MATPAPPTDCLHTLERSDEFRAIVKRATRSCLTYDDMCAMPLPPGVDAEQTWGALRAILRLSAIDETVPDLDGTMYWYYRTHELSDAIATILCHCRAGSSLDRQLATAQNRRVVTRLRLDETVAAAHLDGLDISAADAYEMLERGRSPKDSTEQILMNSYETLIAVEQFVDRPFSPELFQELLGMLLKKVTPDDWRMTEPRKGLLQHDYSDDQVAALGGAQLDHICAFANGEVGEDSDSPVLRALLIADMFRFYRPLPHLNGQLGRLAFKLYAIKAGLPVLGSLSLSRSKLLWEEGELGQPLVALDPARYQRNYYLTSPDLTQYYTTGVQLMLSSLIELREKLADIERRDAELRNLLQGDSAINHRQRSVLGRALRNPSADFTIAHHKRKHQVAYATARADFIDLEERGWLRSEVRGKAFVYTAVPNLRQILSVHERRTSKTIELRAGLPTPSSAPQ